ncbi:hypothetical protein AHiyo8_pI68540 (plasmid) [Arthrobacter sp. Hiyo8]|nr:hypothetical protein AHiyo8_pI68540 [Arthrobacter sp. Hiyo8]
MLSPNRHSSSRRRSASLPRTSLDAIEVNPGVNAARKSASFRTSRRSRVPHLASTSSLSRPRLAGSSSFSSLGTFTQGAPFRRVNADSSGGIRQESTVQRVQRLGHPGLQVGDELGRVQGLAQGFVVEFTRGLEVRGRSSSGSCHLPAPSTKTSRRRSASPKATQERAVGAACTGPSFRREISTMRSKVLRMMRRQHV